MIRFVLLFLFAATANGATYYISNNGNDSNSGTSTGSPWQTLAEIGRRGLSPGDIVRLNRGDVWNESLPIPDDGSSGNPITYDAYGSGDLPEVNGGTPLSGWSTHPTYGWQTSNSIDIRYIYVNGALQTQSRWPDSGYACYDRFDPTEDDCKWIEDDSLVGRNFTGSRLWIKNRNYWIVGNTIGDHSGDRLTFSTVGLGTFSCRLSDACRYYIEDELTETNAIGEWHDTGGTVYLEWTQDPDNESSVIATVDNQDAVAVSNRDHITINNIRFAYWGGHGFDLANVRNWTFDGIEVQYIGRNGIDFAQENGSSDIIIRNSTFLDILGENDGGGGIYIHNNDDENNFLIENIRIERVGGSPVWTSTVGTNIRGAFGINLDINFFTIRDSIINQTSLHSLWVGTLIASPIFEDNEFRNFCQTINDCAGIYWGRDHPVNNPSISRRNLFQIDTQYTNNTSTVSGMYTDRSAANVIMENNVLINPGEYCYLCNECNNNTYRYNSCYMQDGWGKSKGIRIKESTDRLPATGFEFYGNIIYNAHNLTDNDEQMVFENVYRPSEPPEPSWDYMDENIWHMPDRSAALCSRASGSSCSGSNDYTVSQWCSEFGADCDSFANDPQYNDPENGDLSLRASSPAIDNGRTSSYPATDINGVPRPIGSRPDIGAYEYGGAPPDPSAPSGSDGRGFDRGFERGTGR